MRPGNDGGGRLQAEERSLADLGPKCDIKGLKCDTTEAQYGEANGRPSKHHQMDPMSHKERRVLRQGISEEVVERLSAIADGPEQAT